MALAMTALLLTAVGAAMDASFASYDQNDRISDTTQTTRAILGRLSNEIRTADAVTTTATSVSIIPPANAQGLTLIVYAYANGALTMSRTVSGATTVATLLDHTGEVRISGFAVTATHGHDSHGVDCTRGVSVRLGIYEGNVPLSLTASAAPRRNQGF
jgi:hypothetical protein